MTLVIVGLGNPGREYAETRHNAGLTLLEYCSARMGISLDRNQGDFVFGEGIWKGRKLIFVFPLTYMNMSGRVIPWLRKKGVQDPGTCLILQDDLDTPFGVVRFREKGRSGGQKGVESIIKAAGSTDIPRIKIGIGRPLVIGGDVSQYVLSHFSKEERERLPALMDFGYSLIEKWVLAHSSDIED